MDTHDCPSPGVLEALSLGQIDDDSIRAHVDSCQVCSETLQDIRDNNDFLEEFAGVGKMTEAKDSISETPPPDILPGYRIEEELYRGGQGIIYRATQIRTKRPVAFKMLLRGSLSTTRQRLRFEREAEIAAGLRHPGIVTIYDAGYLDDGRFGFAMELIEGMTLDQWAPGKPPSNRESLRTRLKLFAAICDAASYAHQHGVIHRDLKPANILIDSEQKPHILDFGIAKALELDTTGPMSFAHAAAALALPGNAKPHQTIEGEFAGTPAYASPEQVSGDPRAIDTRTDVYSLGVILYQLLTGTLPYSVKGSLHQVVERITQQQPKPPSSVDPIFDDDIDAILLRALHKDKGRRYESVANLKQDIELYLDGRPLDTRRDSAWYVIRKTVRRHWIATSSTAVAVLLLAVFAGAMTLLYNQKKIAEIETRQELRRRSIEHGRTEGLSGDGARALDLLWRAHLEPAPGMPAPRVLRFGGACEPLDSYWALWEYYEKNPCLKAVPASHKGGTFKAVSSPAGTRLATCGNDGVRIWSIPGLRLLYNIPTDDHVLALAFADDGRSILILTTGGEVSRWSIDNPEELIQIETSRILPFDSNTAAFSPNGLAAIVNKASGNVLLYDLSEIHDKKELDCGPGSIQEIRFNNNGHLLATVSNDFLDYDNQQSTISIWSMPDATLLTRTVDKKIADKILFTPDADALIWTTRTFEIRSWAFTTERPPETIAIADSLAEHLCWFVGETPLLASADVDRTIRLRDIESGFVVGKLSGHPKPIRALVAPHGQDLLISGGTDGLIRLWEYGKQAWTSLQHGGIRGAHSVAFSPDGSMLAWTKNSPQYYSIITRTTDLDATTRTLHGHESLITSIAFNHDSRLLASADDQGVLMVWDTETGEVLHRLIDHQGSINSIAFSPHANRIASAGNDNTIVLRDLDSDRVLRLEGHTARIPALAFTHDGSTLVSGSMDGTVRFWDTKTGAPLAGTRPHNGEPIRTLCLSPDGTLLATGSDDHTIALTDRETGDISLLRSHPDKLFALAFGPDSRVLVSGDRAGNLMLWDVENRAKLLTLRKHRDMVMSISVSPDGSQMATCSAGFGPEVRLWDLGAFAPHIAGNLVFQASRLSEIYKRNPTNAAAMGDWMSEVLMPRPELPIPHP